jgi:hypothetical protein
MRLGGFSVILILGIINFALLSFQIATGFHWIKVPFGIHRKTGVALFAVASLHGFLAIVAD